MALPPRDILKQRARAFTAVGPSAHADPGQADHPGRLVLSFTPGLPVHDLVRRGGETSARGVFYRALPHAPRIVALPPAAILCLRLAGSRTLAGGRRRGLQLLERCDEQAAMQVRTINASAPTGHAGAGVVRDVVRMPDRSCREERWAGAHVVSNHPARVAAGGARRTAAVHGDRFLTPTTRQNLAGLPGRAARSRGGVAFPPYGPVERIDLGPCDGADCAVVCTFGGAALEHRGSTGSDDPAAAFSSTPGSRSSRSPRAGRSFASFA